jgi:integrase
MLARWATAKPTRNHAAECQKLGRLLTKARYRLDPSIPPKRFNARPEREVAREHRRPHIFSPADVRQMLDVARSYPSPDAPLRPMVLYTMVVLAYCAGLRRSELAGLDLGDVDLQSDTITVRETKFYKTRILPLTGSVMAELRAYIDARRRAGAPQDPQSGLFWHEHFNDRYTPVTVSTMITNVMRRAGFKAPTGRTGPRVHDLRHSMVVNRILQWYRSGVNPQDKLRFLSTYMGHRDINSTLVYITVTQDLLQEASERFRTVGARCLTDGGAAMTKGNPFPALLRAFFQEWLAEQRSASVHTIRSYRDTWRLFLRFIAERKGGGVARIMLADVSAGEVRAFLHHTEHGRRGTIGTRNCRLAAIRSFFSFVADKDPEYIAQCAEVLTVPLKREPTVRTLLSRAGGGRGDPRPARPVDNRGNARPCAALVPLQQRRAHPGGPRPLSRGDPVRRTELRASLRQGAQGTHLSALAGNRDVAQEVAGAPPACARSSGSSSIDTVSRWGPRGCGSNSPPM